MINPGLALISSTAARSSGVSQQHQSAPARLGALPEMVDHVGHAEEREDEGAGPAVALPDEVAAGIPSLAKPLLCDGPV